MSIFNIVKFTFSGGDKIILNSGSYYVAVVEYTGTASNYVLVGCDNTTPTHTGNGSNYYSAAWHAAAAADRIFYVYTDYSLSGAGPFYWRVRGTDPSGSGTWGAWSPGDSTLGYDHFHISTERRVFLTHS